MTKWMNRLLGAAIFSFLGALPVHADETTLGKYVKLGPYQAYVVENAADAPYVVYLHGYGGSGEDVHTHLERELRTSAFGKRVNWIFPDAPDRAWFPIRGEDFERWKADLVGVRKKLAQMLKSAKVDPERVIWAGFSQGALVATDFIYHSESRPLGLFLNSPFFVADANFWTKPKISLQGVPFRFVHDPRDDIVPIDEAEKLAHDLAKNGMTGALTKKRIGHTMNTPALREAVSALTKDCNTLLRPRS